MKKLLANVESSVGEIALSGRAREHMGDMPDCLEPDSGFRKQVVGYITRTYEKSTVEEMVTILTARNHEQDAKEAGRKGMTYWEEGEARGHGQGRGQG